jgi:hypothetical protein
MKKPDDQNLQPGRTSSYTVGEVAGPGRAVPNCEQVLANDKVKFAIFLFFLVVNIP